MSRDRQKIFLSFAPILTHRNNTDGWLALPKLKSEKIKQKKQESKKQEKVSRLNTH